MVNPLVTLYEEVISSKNVVLIFWLRADRYVIGVVITLGLEVLEVILGFTVSANRPIFLVHRLARVVNRPVYGLVYSEAATWRCSVRDVLRGWIDLGAGNDG